MTTSEQSAPVKRQRRINTLFLGPIGTGSDEASSSSAIPANNNPSSGENASADAPAKRRKIDAMRDDASSKNDNFATTTPTNFSHLSTLARPLSATLEAENGALASSGLNVDAKRVFTASTTIDPSTGDFSMDSDIFALVVAKNSAKSDTNLENDSLQIPELTIENIRIAKHIIEQNTKIARKLDSANIIEPIPVVQNEIVVKFKRTNDSLVSVVRALSPPSKGNALKCVRICGCDDQLANFWEVLTRAGITMLEANQNWTLASSEHRELLIISTKTGRLHRTLKFESPVAILFLNDNVSLIILANGELSTWNLEKCEQILRTSLAPALSSTADVSLAQCALSESGVPMVSLSNDDCLVYSKTMAAWMSVNAGVDSISGFIEFLQFISKHAPNGLIAHLIQRKKTPAVELHADLSASCEETQFEVLLVACEAMESWLELRLLFGIYARKLIKKNKRDKLMEALRELSKNMTDAEFDKLLQHLRPIFNDYGTSYEELSIVTNGNDVFLSFID